MKIALYARVSSETQAKEGTIDSQIEALRDYAKKNNLEVAFECLDNGYSGTTLVRPGLDHLRDLAQAGSIEGVLLLSPDRLSRNQSNQIILAEEFKKRNVKLIFTTQNFDDTPQGKFMFQMLGSVAELERAMIADRMRRGLTHAIKNGQVSGTNPPYGYYYIPKNKNEVGHYDIKQDEAKIVRYIFDLYVNQKLKGTQIVSRLNAEGVPSRGAKWWSGHVYSLLKNEAYIGTTYMRKTFSVEPKKRRKEIVYRKYKNSSHSPRPRADWIGIPVAPIVDDETWRKAQELLRQNAYRARRNNNKNQYLVRGLVHCGLCGSVASGYVSNKSTYYSCAAKRHKNIYSKPHDELIQVNHKWFDDKIWNGLIELLGDPAQMKAQLEKRILARQSKLPSSQDPSEIDRGLEALATQEKRIVDAYREEVISLTDLKEQKAKIANKREALTAKKKAALSHSESLGRPEITLKMLGDVSAHFQRVMAKADFSAREKIVNLPVNSIDLMTDKAIVKGNIPIDALTPPDQSLRVFLYRFHRKNFLGPFKIIHDKFIPVRDQVGWIFLQVELTLLHLQHKILLVADDARASAHRPNLIPPRGRR